MLRPLCLSLFLALLSITSLPASADILVGRMGSIKNPIPAPSTKAVGEGFDLYLKKTNEAGGVRGQHLEVVFADDEFNPELVLKNARELIAKDKVIALVSPQGTPGSVALIKSGLLTQSGVATVGPFTGASEVLGGENMFPVRSTYEDEIAALARQMKNLNQKRIAYLYYNASQGPLFAPVFERIIKENGLEYAGAAGFDIIPDADKQAELVTEAANKLLPMHPDAVFAFAVGPTFPLSMKSLLAVLGQGVVRYTFSINNWENLVKQVGVETARGVVFSQAVPYPYAADRRIVREYQADLQKYSPGAKPNFAGLEGFMTAKVLVEAVKRAGPNPTSAKVLAALDTLGRFDLGDYVVNYSHVLHRVEPSVDVTIINRTGILIK